LESFEKSKEKWTLELKHATTTTKTIVAQGESQTENLWHSRL